MVRDKMILVGTSGWTYADWEGRFYPEGIKGAQRLDFYCKRFKTVEVNSTFYRLPFKSLIESWNKRLPEDFHLVLKGSRAVTHLKRLKDCEAEVFRFMERVSPLRNLKCILWQLPPSLKIDTGLLERFLDTLPQGYRYAVEFRHESWWDEHVAKVLGRKNVAFVAISHPKLPSHFYETADFLYVRFHGLGKKLYMWDYSDEELLEWVRKLKPFLPRLDLYAFFNNDYNANAPKNAQRFLELVEQQ